MFNCSFCNYTTPFQANYTKHANTKKHKENIKASLSNTIKENNDVTSSANTEQFSCKTCNFITNTKANLNQHYNSAKHKLRLQNLSTIKYYECKECGICTPSKTDLEKHLSSKKHKKKMEELEELNNSTQIDDIDDKSMNEEEINQRIIRDMYSRFEDEESKITRLIKEMKQKELANPNITPFMKRMILGPDPDNEILREPEKKITEEEYFDSFEPQYNRYSKDIRSFMRMMDEKHEQEMILEHEKRLREDSEDLLQVLQEINEQQLTKDTIVNRECNNAINVFDMFISISITIDTLYLLHIFSLRDLLVKLITDKMIHLGYYTRPFHCSDRSRYNFYCRINNNWYRDEGNKKLELFIKLLYRKINRLYIDWCHDNRSKILVIDSETHKEWGRLCSQASGMLESDIHYIIIQISKEFYLERE